MTAGPVGHVAADEHRVGVADDRGVLAPQLVERGVQPQVHADGVRVVAGVAGVPGHVALEKDHRMAACGEGLRQGAEDGCVAVAPGGGDRQAEDDELHERSPASSSSCSSTVTARWVYVWSARARRGRRRRWRRRARG